MEDNHPSGLRMSPADRLMPQEEMLELVRQRSSLTIGVPREISLQENRIPLVPDGVALLFRNDHQVIMEAGAGITAHFTDHEYSEAGCQIVQSASEVYKADIILKVGPLTQEEMNWLRPKQTVISTLQMSVQKEDYFRGLLAKKVTALAFEMIRDRTKQLAVTRAMSEIAGSTSISIAAEYLAHAEYGR